MRNTIYRFCLCNNQTSIVITENFKIPALLSTSRQIRAETAQLWLRGNEFQFYVKDCDTKLYVRFIKNILESLTPASRGSFTWYSSIELNGVGWSNLVEWCRQVHEGKVAMFKLDSYKAGNLSNTWSVVQAALSIAYHCRTLPWGVALTQLKSLRLVAEKLDQAWAAGESSETA